MEKVYYRSYTLKADVEAYRSLHLTLCHTLTSIWCDIQIVEQIYNIEHEAGIAKKVPFI